MEIFEFLKDGITLRLRVMIIDSIQNVSRTLARSKKLTSDDLDHLIPVWRQSVFTWLGFMDTDQKYERFMQALTRDRDIRGRRLISRANGLDWGTFFRIEHLGVGARTKLEYLAVAVRRSMFEGAVNGETELNAWLRLCGESVGNRRIVTTLSWKSWACPSGNTTMGRRVPYHGVGRSVCPPKA
jgi:hypothetical protein